MHKLYMHTFSWFSSTPISSSKTFYRTIEQNPHKIETGLMQIFRRTCDRVRRWARPGAGDMASSLRRDAAQPPGWTMAGCRPGCLRWTVVFVVVVALTAVSSSEQGNSLLIDLIDDGRPQLGGRGIVVCWWVLSVSFVMVFILDPIWISRAFWIVKIDFLYKICTIKSSM